MTQPERASGSGWRYFPWAIGGAIGLVVAVNAAMITTAVLSFPGKLGRNGFDLSNQYNTVLAAAEREAALGWQVQILWHAGRPMVELRESNGTPLEAALVGGTLSRPLGPNEAPINLRFEPLGGGTHLAAASPPGPGQWQLALTVERGAERMRLTRRIVVP